MVTRVGQSQGAVEPVRPLSLTERIGGTRPGRSSLSILPKRDLICGSDTHPLIRDRHETHPPLHSMVLGPATAAVGDLIEERETTRLLLHKVGSTPAKQGRQLVIRDLSPEDKAITKEVSLLIVPILDLYARQMDESSGITLLADHRPVGKVPLYRIAVAGRAATIACLHTELPIIREGAEDRSGDGEVKGTDVELPIDRRRRCRGIADHPLS